MFLTYFLSNPLSYSYNGERKGFLSLSDFEGIKEQIKCARKVPKISNLGYSCCGNIFCREEGLWLLKICGSEKRMKMGGSRVAVFSSLSNFFNFSTQGRAISLTVINRRNTGYIK